MNLTDPNARKPKNTKNIEKAKENKQSKGLGDMWGADIVSKPFFLFSDMTLG